jgi:ribosomal RNA-processing protein 12
LNQLASQDEGEATTEHTTSIVRSLIGCLSVALRAQSGSAWRQGSGKIPGATMQVYNALLTYITHPKPKIRKAAQHAVCAILKGSFMMTADEAPEFHPAAQVTANECLEKLTLSTDSNAVLHTLILLKEVVSVFSKGAVKAVCDGLLSLMRAKSHPHLTSCAMQMARLGALRLHALCERPPSYRRLVDRAAGSPDQSGFPGRQPLPRALAPVLQ